MGLNDATQVQNVEGSSCRSPNGVLGWLATVSVFIESKRVSRHSSSGSASVPSSTDPVGLARVGGAFAFVTDLQDHWVTAVGEVPPSTVEAIARAVQRTQQASQAPQAHSTK